MRIGDLVALYKVRSVGGIDKEDIGIVIAINSRPPSVSHIPSYTVKWMNADRTCIVSEWILRRVE